MDGPGARHDQRHVVAHVAVSLDGATTGFEVDVAAFYRLAGTWSEDLTLAGADTILAQEQALAQAPGPGPAAGGPLLAVVDGRARVRAWDALRAAGYWSDVIALHARETPPRPPDRGVQEVVAGTDRVDLAAALDRLQADYGVRVVRVDSGGALVGALLDAELVDELSLLVHPTLVATAVRGRWYGKAMTARALSTRSARVLDGGLVWLRYATTPAG